jgi:SAM-dependent methyltransferase
VLTIEGTMRRGGYSSSTTLAYDDAVGRKFFRRAAARFATLARRHGMRFTTAADVGCGTGLFARYLSLVWGAKVFAVDVSPAMLEAARRRCAGLGIDFFRQDLRRLVLPHRVSLVTAHFDTLNHLTGSGDLAMALQSISANLTPGGWLYFDLVTPCAPLGGCDVVVRRVLTGNGLFFEQRAEWLPRRRIIGVRARVAALTRCGGAVNEDRHIERVYGPRELGRALGGAGLVTRGVYDEATLRPADRCPARLVVVAQKPGRRDVTRSRKA